MSTPVSNITYNNTYNLGDCHAVQFGKSNHIRIQENKATHPEIDHLRFEMNRIIEENSEIKAQLEDLTCQMERKDEEIGDLRLKNYSRIGENVEAKAQLEDLACKMERKDEEIAELKDKVADLERKSGSIFFAQNNNEVYNDYISFACTVITLFLLGSEYLRFTWRSDSSQCSIENISKVPYVLTTKCILQILEELVDRAIRHVTGK